MCKTIDKPLKMQALKRKWFNGNCRIIEMSPCQLKQGLLSYFVVYKTHLNMVWKM